LEACKSKCDHHELFNLTLTRKSNPRRYQLNRPIKRKLTRWPIFGVVAHYLKIL